MRMMLCLAPLAALSLLTSASVLALAHPPANSNTLPRAVDAMTINQTEVFSFAPDSSCSVLSCINVIGQAVCIANAIAADDKTAILGCAKKKELCGCAGCYSKLGAFLDKFNICGTSVAVGDPPANANSDGSGSSA
ncbi:hypothetical protein QBC46DRAFT_320809 [Diplogelasinospora grovesii]|uniref:Fungal calcium binding protein domain-containing protein n=1 Tax=Diplogelasinospora grovesii TaxID=303347 RepID=A0AAN6S1S1_9PEZI|nr:hypothetical protein QBC46DRAFT_320809 [Diplogelasinospora grovesii]